MMSQSKNFALLTGSTLLIAVGTYFFKFTNNFTFGGITGLAVLVAKSELISAGDFNFIVNMLLLLLGFLILGKNFAAKTAYCSILLSVALSLLERICPMERPSHRTSLCWSWPSPSPFRLWDPQFFSISALPAAVQTSSP